MEIITDALRGLRVNGKAPLLAAFAHDLQGIKSTVHMEVTDFQTGDLRATKPDLQTNGQHGAIPNTEECCRSRSIKNGTGLFLRKGQCHALTSIDRRPTGTSTSITRTASSRW